MALMTSGFLQRMIIGFCVSFERFRFFLFFTFTMKSKFCIVITVCATAFLWSCKTASGPNDNNNGGGTTPASIGDTIPGVNSLYIYDASQLDMNDVIIPGHTVSNSTTVDSMAV